jgi:hypothetical protein
LSQWPFIAPELSSSCSWPSCNGAGSGGKGP